MKQISGYVLVEGTDVGIPNLVVSAHDARDASGPSANERSIEALGRNLGRRLGSVLTDSSGHFVLNGEDLRFEGNEARPNLVLAVSAPEDVRSAEKPMPHSPEARLLYISAVARRDAGAEEAFVIRLLPAQLEKFGIGTAASAGQATTSASRMADILQAGFDAADLVRDRFQARLQTQVSAAHKRRDAAVKATKNLSGIPQHLRGANNALHNNKFFIPDRDSLTQLPDVQKSALLHGLKRPKGRSSPPIVRLSLSRKEVDDMKLVVNSKGHVSGKASTKAIMAKVRQAIDGYSLISSCGSSTVSVEELQQKYLVSSPSKIIAAQKGAPPPGPPKSDVNKPAVVPTYARPQAAKARFKRIPTKKK